MAAYRDDDENIKVARTAKVQVVPADAQHTHEMPVHMKVVSGRSRYERARRTLRGWAIFIVNYLEAKPGRGARAKEIGREVFEGASNAVYRQLVQSILVDYLGLAKTGRETRSLVEIYPRVFQRSTGAGGRRRRFCHAPR